MLARIRKAREEGDSGFTLIELLVVIIIIGILAAIAIPTFLNQREKAWKKAAISDLRNGATKMEEYFDDNGTYLGFPLTNFKTSGNDTGNADVTLSLPAGAWNTATSYCIQADHAKLPLAADYHLDVRVGRPQTGPCV
jgi:type IV pilus assembly protein PilA